jgi:membrane associated rhomboid family serine protease
MPTFLKIVIAIVVIWLAFGLIGAILKAVVGLLIAAAVVTVIGGIAYAAIKGRSQRQIGR